MAKRGRNVITLGSGEVFIQTYASSATIPTVTGLATFCVDANRLGYIKGGATLSYSASSEVEKDDLGYVQKLITTEEEVKLKLGLITWNGTTLKQLIDRCTITEDSTNHKRIAKIGGGGNAQGSSYVVVFKHTDAVDGDVWVIIHGKNTADMSLAFASGAGTQIEPEFTALPQDANGTLVQIIEDTTT